MSNGDFAKKVKDKVNIDKELLSKSQKNIYGAFENENDIRSTDYKVDSFIGDMYALMDFYHISRVNIPENIDKPESMFSYVMSVTGIQKRRVLLQKKWWKDVSVPLICYRSSDNKAVILIPNNSSYIYYDKNGKHQVNKKSAQEFKTDAYCIYKPFENGKMSAGGFWKFLMSAVSKQDVIWLVLMSILVSLMGLLMPLISKYIFNNVVPSGTSKELFGIGVLLVGSSIVTVIIMLARSIWVLRIGSNIETIGQNAVYARLLNLPVDFFKNYDSGELTLRVEAINKICEILGGQLIPSVFGSLFAFIYLFQIAGLAGDLLIPSVVIILVMLAYFAFDTYFQVKYTKKCNNVNNKLNGFTYQLLNGITKIKVAGAEVRAYSKWADIYEKYPLIPDVMTRITGAVNSFIYFAGVILLYVLAFNAALSPSDFIAFNSAFGAFSAAVLSLAAITRQLASIKPAIDMLKPIIEEEPECIGQKKEIDSLTGDIEVNQVYFRYSENMPYVLNGLNLNIKNGEYIGIVGSSGCGKSTLLRLLLGFEKPDSGSVYYGMQDLTGLNIRSVRQRIGVVLQNGKLFSGDIYSNIVISAPWLSVDDAWEAAEACGFADDIESFPMGMFTMVSEGGGGLSGGQQQRLLIARALAPKPDILMFDEATSALDNITQAQVVHTLENLNCTRIVIAHRLSTIRKCDRIVYMHQGKIVEQGSYEELMKQRGMFAQMAERQLV